MAEFRIMTFNIRGAPEEDGINIWQNRAALNVETIRCCAPDLIGFQEAQAPNLETYQDRLKDYEYELGPISNRPDRLLSNAIFWNPRALTRMASGGFYLSETPHCWSKDWGSGRVRVVNWVRFCALADDRQFLHLNTHLDHISHQARLEGGKLILQQLPQLCADPLPVLLTGDFNSPAEPPSNRQREDIPALPYHIFQAAGFIDAYQAAMRVDDGPENTFHGFKGREFPVNSCSARWRIDWILILSGARSIRVQACEIVQLAAPPLYPSDHYPVMADLRID